MPRKSKRRKTLETRSKYGSKSEISVLDLPAEITLKILSYLDLKCLLKSVSLVCKAWNKLAFDRSLWETVSLNLPTHIRKKKGFKNILKKFSYVPHLFLNRGYIGEQILKEISMLTYLQTLSIWYRCHHYCNPRCSRFCDEISSLDFNKNDENDKYKKIVLKQIKQLKIYGPNMSLRFFKALLNKCSEVRDISLYYGDGNLPSDDDMLKVDAIFLICADTLENFYLDGIFGVNCLKGISNCIKLKKLHVEDCIYYKDEMLFEIMRITNLTDLSLSCADNFTSDGINKMFDEGKLSNLITLKLYFISNLNNINLKTISNNCQKLQVFYISYCKDVTDEGISFIVKKCSNMKDISLILLANVIGLFLLDINNNILKNLLRLEVDKKVYESEFANSLRNTRLELNIIMAS